MIRVENLCKNFTARKLVKKRPLFSTYQDVLVEAVRDISFNIEPGERVAFIGPNGAGKSTTLKMLSGILQPSSGHASVAGFVPWDQRRKLSTHIGLVFGQRSQLWYHLPVRQSFDLIGKIYGLENAVYSRQLDLLAGNFNLGDLLDRPVKSLSLGQRMRCEIAASLIHTPEILFLDEPTIGLDVTTKAELRDHLRLLGEQNGTTIILTSHDTADIEKICDRVILINHGEKLIDTSLEAMRKKYLRQKQLVFVTGQEATCLSYPGLVSCHAEAHRLVIDINPDETPVADVIAKVLQDYDVLDVSVSDLPLEEVIKNIYAGKVAA